MQRGFVVDRIEFKSVEQNAMIAQDNFDNKR